MSRSVTKRQPRGTRVGGQFAPSKNPESNLQLTEPGTDAPERKPSMFGDIKDFAERSREMLETLSKGVANLTSSDEWKRYLDVQSKFHRYSFNNSMLIQIQNPDATNVASFNKWKEMGRFVKKGERPLYVLAPMIGKSKDKVDENGDPLKVVYGFKGVPVFDVSQTDGDPLPSPVSKLTGNDPEGHFDRLTGVAADLGFRVVDHDFTGGVNGDCSHDTKTIRVERANSPAQRVKTLAHELAHAILHEDHVDYLENRGRYELEAESTAYVVCQSLGIDSSDYSFGYVTGWSGGGEEAQTKIRESGNNIQKAAHRIMETLEKADAPAQAA